MKKFASIAVAVLIAIIAFPLGVFAAEPEIVSVEFEDVSVLEYTRGYTDESGNYIYSDFLPSFTVTLKDGRVIQSQDNCVEIDGGWYYPGFDTTDQTNGNYWTGGNTYEITGNILDVCGTFNVTVTKSPIESIEINDVTVIENTFGYEDENGNYIYEWFNPDFTAVFTDGRVVQSQGNSIEIGGEWIGLSYDNSDQYNGNYWTAGNTYEVTASILGVSGTFNVTVLENPIASIEIGDVTVLENTNGYESADGHYIYDSFSPSLTVTLKDGGEISSQYGSIQLNGQSFLLDCDYSDQENGNYWTAGNTYEVTGTLLGVSDTFNVTVTENPVESIEINDFSVMENTHGYEDENGHYIYSSFSPSFTVTLKDGGELVSQDDSIEIGGEIYHLSIDISDQYNGNYWTVGNTYEVCGTIFGVSDTFRISVIGSPVISLEVSDFSVMENTHGYEDESGHYIYSDFFPSFTVTLNDGSKVQSQGGGVEIDGMNYYINFDISDQYNGNYWTVGNTYAVTGSILGVSDTFNVTVTETTIRSIEINDISVIENTHGYDDGEGHYIYEMLYPDFTVTFKDGTQIESNGSFVIIDGEWCFLEYDIEDQYMGDYWTVGNTYQVTGGICGFTDTFNVTIIPSPVERIEINDISIIENTNGYEDEDGNFIYSGIYPEYTVYMKDGSVISSNKEAIEIDGEEYYMEYVTEDQYDEYWTVGNSYQATGTFLGVSDTFNINIIENPIAYIELIKQPDKTQYTVGEYFDLKGATVRLNYNDGSHEDFDIEYTCGAYLNRNAEYYSSKLDMLCYFECDVMFDSAGRQSVEIGFLNRSVECAVNVTDNLWESISIEEGDDRSLVITATGSNGTVTHLKVLDMMFGYGEETDEGQSVGGVIITDGGIFDGVLNLMGDGRFSIGINVSGLPDDVEERSIVTSNYLTEGDWLTARLILGEIYPVWSVPVTQFYGRITADNIDGLIKVAVMSMTMDLIENSAITDKGDYLEIDGEAIQGAVSLIFAVDGVDMTLSENYDAETGMYRFYDDGTDEAYTNIMPMELFYENGCWCLKATVLGKPGEAADTYTVKLDEEFRISVIYTDNTLIIGDANSDGKVNGIDVNYMKRALSGTYDINIAMDVSGDGKVNGTDVNLLKRYLVGSYVI